MSKAFCTQPPLPASISGSYSVVTTQAVSLTGGQHDSLGGSHWPAASGYLPCLMPGTEAGLQRQPRVCSEPSESALSRGPLSNLLRCSLNQCLDHQCLESKGNLKIMHPNACQTVMSYRCPRDLFHTFLGRLSGARGSMFPTSSLVMLKLRGHKAIKHLCPLFILDKEVNVCVRRWKSQNKTPAVLTALLPAEFFGICHRPLY